MLSAAQFTRLHCVSQIIKLSTCTLIGFLTVFILLGFLQWPECICLRLWSVVHCHRHFEGALSTHYVHNIRLLFGYGHSGFPHITTSRLCVCVLLQQEHYLYDTQRCHAFVCDVTNMDEVLPFPENSLDVITLIFILSAVSPEKYRATF